MSLIGRKLDSERRVSGCCIEPALSRRFTFEVGLPRPHQLIGSVGVLRCTSGKFGVEVGVRDAPRLGLTPGVEPFLTVLADRLQYAVAGAQAVVFGDHK